MVAPEDSVSTAENGNIPPSPPSTPRTAESNGKSKFKRICKYLGFEDKKFWDWLDLLLAPFLVSFLLFWLGLYFDGRAKRKEEDFNSERNKQEILRSYLTTMTKLISDGKLSNQNKTALTNKAAKALTQSALTSFDQASPTLSASTSLDKTALIPSPDTNHNSTLLELLFNAIAHYSDTIAHYPDANRKGQILRFLYDANLITNNSPKIDMEGVDLTGANLQKFTLTPTGQQKQPFIIINLSKANLYRANLHSAQLMKAQMQGTQLPQAHLEGADLKGAKLKEANLQGANLTGANLEGANLNYADLTNANLTGANLSGGKNTRNAKLISANLKGAKLIGADLEHAQLNGADLTDADFRDADGMETADMQNVTLCRTTMSEGTVNSDSCPGQAQS